MSNGSGSWLPPKFSCSHLRDAPGRIAIRAANKRSSACSSTYREHGFEPPLIKLSKMIELNLNLIGLLRALMRAQRTANSRAGFTSSREGRNDQVRRVAKRVLRWIAVSRWGCPERSSIETLARGLTAAGGAVVETRVRVQRMGGRRRRKQLPQWDSPWDRRKASEWEGGADGRAAPHDSGALVPRREVTRQPLAQPRLDKAPKRALARPYGRRCWSNILLHLRDRQTRPVGAGDDGQGFARWAYICRCGSTAKRSLPSKKIAGQR